jgi:hypothetical protein
MRVFPFEWDVRNGGEKHKRQCQIVQKSEAVQAVIDYFNRVIAKQEAISVVMAYFNG